MPQGHAMRHGIGDAVVRKEDRRLLTGSGRFSDDVNVAGQAHAAVLRSPHAHARIRGIDSAEARAAPGVLAVLTIDDYLADGLNGVAHAANTADAVDTSKRSFRDGAFVFEAPHLPLAHGTVRHVGDPVALVVAETEAALALDGEGTILALRVALTGNIGGYPVSYVPLANGSNLVTTVYRIPCVHIEVRGVLTNTVPVIQFRGAGRPEAMYAMERLIDLAAAKTGIDRVELRRRNLIPPDAMPYRNPRGLTY